MKTTKLWQLIEGWLDVQMFRPTQAQLARGLGVTRSAVSQWKRGQSRPTPENLRDLARLTGIPFHDLRIAVVEDLGYTLEGHDHGSSASISRAPGSGASEPTVRVETGDIPANPLPVEEPEIRRFRGPDA